MYRRYFEEAQIKGNYISSDSTGVENFISFVSDSGLTSYTGKSEIQIGLQYYVTDEK